MDPSQIPSVKEKSYEGKFIGNPKGNLECGSAQSSLLLWFQGSGNNLYGAFQTNMLVILADIDDNDNYD